MKILVVGPSWIGDTILAQPLFKLLHERHGALALDVLAPPWTLPVLERMPEVRRALENPFGHGELRIGQRRRLARELAREHYEQALVLPNSFKSALIPFFAGIPARTGYLGELRWGLLTDARRAETSGKIPLALLYAALAIPRGTAPPAPFPLPAPGLRVDEGARRATLSKLGLAADGPAAVLCPGAEYGPAKRWPARYFAELAQGLTERGDAVWLVGSKGDAEAGAEIARASGARDLCGRTSLAEAIDVLASARLVVSNDSGLMHVAAALGKPLVALYGSSSPAYTPPLAAGARLLKLDLPCSPCFQRTCPLGHFKCMMDLSPRQVMDSVRQVDAGDYG